MEAPLQVLLAASASLFFVSLLFGLAVLLYRRLSDTHHRSRPTDSVNPTLSRPHTSPDESISFDPSLGTISMAELAAATRDFSPDCIVGEGSFGFVYKAHLPCGATVAVKRLSADAFDGYREFRAEVETLGRLRHPNLARILAYCASGRDRLLVYEFLEKGSLDQWLHGATHSPPPLPWPTRLQVIRGVAAGLAFLHHGCKPRVIHRDIKASNVLLDAGFESRVADFGLARRVDSSRSHVSTQVAGTLGYMAPEYEGGLAAATTKADVYSFGVLMLEVATGRRPNWPVVVEGKEVALVRWARGMVEEGRGAEILDRRMGKEGLREEEVRGFLDVAYRCTHGCSKERPCMEEVVSLLDPQL